MGKLRPADSEKISTFITEYEDDDDDGGFYQALVHHP
jgi:hypothetical protein